MADNGVERAWKEDVAFWEKGSRIFHYTLLDTARNSLLVAVAIEKKDRHMTYSVSAEFLRAFGPTSTVNAETKWTSRDKVVQWIKSLVASNDPIFPISSQGVTGKIPSLDCPESSMAHLSSHKNNADAEGSKKSAFENSEIIWSGKPWICNKQLKHYPSFCRGGINIAVYSFVYVMGEKEREHIAYVQDLYDDQNSNKMVRVRWFNSLKDVEDLISDMETRSNEIFMTPHGQDISAECINGIATVLTPIHFDKCLRFIPEFVPSETFLCHREVRNRKIKHFYFSELHGYSSQPILSCLMNNAQYVAEGEASDQPKLVQKPQHFLAFNVNDNVEILSQDSGLRGCWFRCKIVRVSQKRLRVQYYDILDDDSENPEVEEWVSSHRVANPDVSGMRHAGRLTIRPMPSEDKSDSTEFSVGSAIDAWWCDGWWEGILIGFETSSPNNLKVFLPGERLSLTIERKNVRTSRDWIDGEWTNITPNPNVLSSISSILNPNNTPTSSTSHLTGTNNSVPVISNIHSINRHQGPKDPPASSS